MRDRSRTKPEPIEATAVLKQRIKELEQSESVRNRTEEEIAVLAEIGRVICSTMDIDEVYDRFAAEARQLIPFDRVTVSLCDTRAKLITLAYVSGADLSNYKQGDSVPLTGTLFEELLRERTGQIIQSERMDEIVGRIPTFARNFRAGLRSLIGVPLIYKDEVVGVLYFWSKTPNGYTEQDLRLAERIGDQIAGAIANAQLFADLKKTEMSLRESEGRFRAMVEEAPVGVAEVEVGTGRFLTVNRRLCEMVGRTREELLATTFHTITHPADLHMHAESKALLLAGKIRYYRLEKRYIRNDGEIVWVNITVSPLWKPGETPGRHITVIEEITERKQAEEALNRAHGELQVKNITLRELNTTLNVLLKQREDDKRSMEERFVMNIQNLVLPFVEAMKKGRLDVGQQPCLDIIEAHLRDIATPLLKNMRQFNLTPRELRVAALIRNGKTTKEIAEALSVATGSIDIHRINIRKKLGLTSRKARLQSYLEALV